MYISLEEQLRDAMKRNSKYLRREHLESINIRDIYDGRMFKKYGDQYAALTMNADGLAVYKTGGKSVWALQLLQNYLPTKIRYKPENIIVVALFFGHKPNMKRLLHPLILELEKLIEDGIHVTINMQDCNIRPVLAACTVDLPAKHSLMNINSFNGYYSCTVCEHPGKQVERSNGRSFPRYTFQTNPAPIRDTRETLQIMSNTTMRRNPIKGIRDISALTAVPAFDIINGITIDYMHCVCLGVFKRLLWLWLDPSNHGKRFYLSVDQINIINARLTKIKPCSYISRRPENIKKFGTYKAHEFRTFFLYYLRPCCEGVLPKEFLEHTQLLCSAIYIFLGTNISPEEMRKASSRINEFVEKFEKLYGAEHMVMNIHSLLHLEWSVKNWGPLWAQSAFCFENMNGVLARFVKGNRFPLHQIWTKYLISRSLSPVDKPGTTIARYPKQVTLSTKERDALNNNGIDASQTSFHSRTMVDNVIYTSRLYRLVNSIDYFVGIADVGGFIVGKIVFFFESDNIELCLVEIFNIEKECDQYKYVKSSNDLDVFPTELIATKFIYTTRTNMFSTVEIIVDRPNKIENE